MARFINPFTDVGFKMIFGQEINKDLLIDFLNSLLAGEKEIKEGTKVKVIAIEGNKLIVKPLREEK